MSYRAYNGDRTEFYEAAPEVAETVNLAIMLGRPILVEGEAGCGKTMLAVSIAHELGLADELVVISIKSTSQAKDLLYRFDALRRLHDTQLRNDLDAEARARHVYPYITLQPLGKVIHDGQPAVVLIDEIDKADLDFPNDLLDVLGDFSFTIEELPAEEDEICIEKRGFGRKVVNKEGVRPVVVVTSNREKQLPEPFLRRCLYVQLQFPEDDQMLARIVRKNLGAGVMPTTEGLVAAAVQAFREVRKGAILKPPGTSELVDWIRVLAWKNVTENELSENVDLPPFWRVLFKTQPDLDAFEASTKNKGAL